MIEDKESLKGHANVEKMAHQLTRYKNLSLDEREKVRSLNYYTDLDLLALEGLEISSGLSDPIAVRLLVSKVSGRFYLDISDPQLEPIAEDETLIKAHSHNWVKVEED